MGAETAALGAGALGATAGALKGGKGTPSQTVTNQTQIAGPSQQEQELQSQSLENYARQQNEIDQLQQRLGLYDPLQQASIGQAQNILSGQAFQMTPEEQQQVESLRQALVAQSQAPVQQLIDENLRKVTSQASQRGLRGQALTELQGRVLQTGAQQLGEASRNAATQSAQLGLSLPYQRLNAQAPYIQGGMTLRNQLGQQAIQNRQLAQSPALLQNLLQERLAGASRTQTTPGQGGGFVDALLGGAAGLGSGIQGYSNIRSALGSLSTPQQQWSTNVEDWR